LCQDIAVDPAHTTRLHFIGGEKGGVGKSVVARVLAQYFIDRNIPFLGFDTDKSHGSLLRFYAEFAAAVVIDRYEGLDRIVEAAAEQPGRRIIVDLAAQTHRFLAQWMEDSGLLDIRDELGLALTYWHVMDSGRDSAELLVKVLDQFGERLPLVVVLNEVRGGDFTIAESSGALARAKELGAAVITLRQLPDATMQKIDAHSTSFWAATTRGSKDGSALGLLERQRVKNWLHKAYEEIGRLDP
jgi:CobQ/CobB/MinD/ParA nucleotide binding domain